MGRTTPDRPTPIRGAVGKGQLHDRRGRVAETKDHAPSPEAPSPEAPCRCGRPRRLHGTVFQAENARTGAALTHASDGGPACWAYRAADAPSAPSGGHQATGDREAGPLGADDATQDPLRALVEGFSAALLEKLRASERKGRRGWERDDWMEICRAELVAHVAKGDPVDVGAFAAFLWWHGERTASADAPASARAAPASAWEAEARMWRALAYPIASAERDLAFQTKRRPSWRFAEERASARQRVLEAARPLGRVLALLPRPCAPDAPPATPSALAAARAAAAAAAADVTADATADATADVMAGPETPDVLRPGG